jgi:hypothetical protein
MSIYQLVPDPEAVLKLEPEELAGVVLQYLNSSKGLRLNRHNFSLPSTVQEYPLQYHERISEALMEAWMWLEREGLIAPRPGATSDGTAGYPVARTSCRTRRETRRVPRTDAPRCAG